MLFAGGLGGWVLVESEREVGEALARTWEWKGSGRGIEGVLKRMTQLGNLGWEEGGMWSWMVCVMERDGWDWKGRR